MEDIYVLIVVKSEGVSSFFSDFLLNARTASTPILPPQPHATFSLPCFSCRLSLTAVSDIAPLRRSRHEQANSQPPHANSSPLPLYLQSSPRLPSHGEATQETARSGRQWLAPTLRPLSPASSTAVAAAALPRSLVPSTCNTSSGADPTDWRMRST